MRRGNDVSKEERSLLQSRLGSGDLSDAVAVQDVAEATGLSHVEVMAHLRQIRAESGFSPEVKHRAPVLPFVAGAALLTAAGVTWWRIQAGQLAFAPEPPSPQAPMVVSQAPVIVTHPAISNLSRDYLSSEALKVPTGFNVEAAGQRVAKVSQSSGDPVRAVPYQEIFDGLVNACEVLVQGVADAEGTESVAEDTRYMDREGKIFAPRKGHVRVMIDGWSGDSFAYIPVPLTPAGREGIRKMVVSVLGDAKTAQDDALRPADYRVGTITPPPGFNVRFAGRRLDSQNGPRVSFSDLPMEAVAKRMEAALLNAIYRDGRAPTGPWSGSAVEDAKIPRPNLSHVEITGPGGMVVADIPTRSGEEGATHASVRELAERVAKQVLSVGKVRS